ncbi:STAS domain-containing protein [Jeotgalibacillus proteolyticus]|uniref:STAS domain-containing protein n=1 Tax=Jeotgalibacillus proteolyticus TaxID=2082395 RepID=UPI003CED6841
MSSIETLALPAIVMNKEMRILESSNEALNLFGGGEKIIDWIDAESQTKAEKFLLDSNQSKIELNMITKNNQTALFTLHVKWTEETCSIVFMEQEALLLELMTKINEHKKRLQETDMELLLKNNQLNTSFQRIQELSTAIIHLAPTVILIPVFGDLDGTLLEQSKARILSHISQNGVHELIVDMQSVGNMEAEGIRQLIQLIGNCSLMGAKTYITGVKPEHADVLNRYNMLEYATFINTLKHTIARLV